MTLTSPVNRRLSVAPMMEWTDSLYRQFMRLITHETLLYTEMVTAQALIHGDPKRFLTFEATEHPLALQLGGGDPKLLSQATQISADFGFDEINLNAGCPSDRVHAGRFGACLMTEPEIVAECVHAMKSASSIPVTVKHRIGVDDTDSYEDLHKFITTVAAAGCETFVVHARKALLGGLSPKENREVPPLRYDIVHQVKKDFPNLEVIINGGIRNLDQALDQLGPTDGVMIGRAAYETPYIFADADQRIFGSTTQSPTLQEVLNGLGELAAKVTSNGTALPHLSRHVMGLFHSCKGAKNWRRMMGEDARDPQYVGQKAADLIHEASKQIPEEILNTRPTSLIKI